MEYLIALRDHVEGQVDSRGLERGSKHQRHEAQQHPDADVGKPVTYLGQPTKQKSMEGTDRQKHSRSPEGQPAAVVGGESRGGLREQVAVHKINRALPVRDVGVLIYNIFQFQLTAAFYNGMEGFRKLVRSEAGLFSDHPLAAELDVLG